MVRQSLGFVDTCQLTNCDNSFLVANLFVNQFKTHSVEDILKQIEIKSRICSNNNQDLKEKVFQNL